MIYIKKTLKLLLKITIIVHILLFLFSISNVITTIILYCTLLYIIYCLIKKYQNQKRNLNILIGIGGVIVTLFLFDIYLRYSSDKYQNYSEKNGSVFYTSSFFDNKIRWIYNNISGKNFNSEIITYYKNDTIELVKEEFTDTVIMNSLGFRSPELDTISSKYKILALGDSFTEGIGSPVDSTWPYLISQKIQNQLDIEVSYFNGGLSGSDPFKSYYILQQLISKNYHPDLIILLINSSDLLEYYFNEDEKRFSKNYKGPKNLGPWWEPLYASSYIVRLISKKVYKLDDSFLTESSKEKIYREAEQAIKNLFINRFKPLTDSIQSKLLIFCNPLEYEIDNPFFSSLEDLPDYQIHYKNLAPDIREYYQNPLTKNRSLYWKLDMHFNPKGYNYISDVMIDYIQQHEIIKKIDKKEE